MAKHLKQNLLIKMPSIGKAFLFCFIFCAGNLALAQVYQYSDSKGMVHITNVLSSPQCERYGCRPVVDEPASSQAEIASPQTVQTAAPKATVATPPDISEKNEISVSNINQQETTATPEDAIRSVLTKWLDSWKSGDMATYRRCYAPDFHSKRMNLDDWIAHKENIFKKSKNVNITIAKLKISAQKNNASATFMQSYSSSIFEHYAGKKKLELKKIKDDWKIYREIM